MNVLSHRRAGFATCSLALAFQALATVARAAEPSLPQQQTQAAAAPAARHDGEHDFDFEIGTWQTRLSRLERPLTGSTTWVHYTGSTVVSKVWNGRANLVELDVTGPAGRLQGLSLRLYNPAARQWSLHFSNIKSGVLAAPAIGSFTRGRGEFFSQETFNDRAILVRFVIADVTADSCRFEQSFSEDGGKTWEVNWIAVDTRVQDRPPARPGP